MPVYSHSRLSTFENCPLQYKFIYIDKIKTEEEGIEAFLGSRFHEAMEKLYINLKYGAYSLGELVGYYESCWDKEWNVNVVIIKKDRTSQDYRNLGKKLIEDYYKRYYPFDSGRVIGLEKKIEIQLDDDGKYKMRGVIDRLMQADDYTYEIRDYKTSGNLPCQKELDSDRQLALYQIGIENIWNDVKNVKLIWHYVVFDKEMASTRTKDELEKIKKDTIALIDQIESTQDFLPKESNLCEWCKYQELCPKRKHLFKVKSMPVNEYLKDDGVKLVNTFSILNNEIKGYKDKIKKTEEELEKLKEAVIKFSEKENIEVITGSGHKLKISDRQSVSSPPKGSAERKELENILHEINKWDEVCTLDTNEIKKAVDEEKWDKEIIDRIKKFFTAVTKKEVRISKFEEKEK